MAKPTVLTFCDYYLPGYKAGGPLQTIGNMVEHLSDELSFRIVTQDRDLGDGQAYSDCVTNIWCSVGKAQVLYLHRRELGFRIIRSLIRQTDHDFLYLNSMFSPGCTILPLALRRLGLIQSRPTIIAPRGELAVSALSTSRFKKRIFQVLARSLRLHRNLTWQASSSFEAADIRQQIGDDASVVVAPDLPPRISADPPACISRNKRPGSLKVLFLSRVHPVKNLDGALRMFDGLQGRVEFDIYGPLEDQAYWKKCQTLMKSVPANVTVRYRGSVPNSNVPTVMAKYDVLLLPTHGENFGHVILESLLAGCPVLISDRTPWRGLAAAGVGWDVALDNTSGFRTALQQAVDAGEAEHFSKSERARAFARQHCLDQTSFQQNRELFGLAVNRQPMGEAA